MKIFRILPKKGPDFGSGSGIPGPHLDSFSLSSGLSQVADPRGAPDLCVWQYNETRCLDWLTDRVQAVQEVLAQQVTGLLMITLKPYQVRRVGRYLLPYRSFTKTDKFDSKGIVVSLCIENDKFSFKLNFSLI